MAKKRSDKVPPLTVLYVYVTDRCNCSCKHCWIVSDASHSKGKSSHFLSSEIFEAAVVEAKPLGLGGVKWTGGEPTIHPDFREMLKLQKKYQLRGQLETNGMEVSPALARLLYSSGTSHVSVSLDGSSPETHEAIRGVKGAYKRTLTGIKNLVDAGLKPQIIMSLMSENALELESLLELAKKVGAGSVKFNVVQPTLRGEDIHSSGQALSIAEFIETSRRLEVLRSNYPFPIFFDIPMAFRPLNRMLSGNGCSICGIKTILGLLADGSYALCGIGENLPDLVFGKAGAGGLEKIWGQHPVLSKIRKGLPAKLKGVCSQCLMKSACLGSCVAQNYYRKRDILADFWFCEMAAKEGFFPESRLHPQSVNSKTSS